MLKHGLEMSDDIYPRPMILSYNVFVYSMIEVIMYGINTMTAPKMTIILGTKVSVISWIEVKVWKIAISKPIARPAAMMGPPDFKMTRKVNLEISSTSAWFIL